MPCGVSHYERNAAASVRGQVITNGGFRPGPARLAQGIQVALCIGGVRQGESCHTMDPYMHWRYIRTNNHPEHLNREIRRRTRVVGSFPDGHAALILVCARYTLHGRPEIGATEVWAWSRHLQCGIVAWRLHQPDPAPAQGQLKSDRQRSYKQPHSPRRSLEFVYIQKIKWGAGYYG